MEVFLHGVMRFLHAKAVWQGAAHSCDLKASQSIICEERFMVYCP